MYDIVLWQEQQQSFRKNIAPTERVETSYTENVLKFRTLVACHKGLDKQGRPISVCF